MAPENVTNKVQRERPQTEKSEKKQRRYSSGTEIKKWWTVHCLVTEQQLAQGCSYIAAMDSCVAISLVLMELCTSTMLL